MKNTNFNNFLLAVGKFEKVLECCITSSLILWCHRKVVIALYNFIKGIILYTYIYT